MKLKESSAFVNRYPNTTEEKRVLLIGPAPYREGGSVVTFELMFDHLRKLSHLNIRNINLPVHHPLYSNSGAPGPLSHSRTIIEVLRAISLIPRSDNIVIFGSSDICFSYGLIPILSAKLFRKHCAVRITGGRAMFRTLLLPTFIRSACLAMARVANVFLVQTGVARDDLPAQLRAKAIVIRGFRPRPPFDLPPVRRKEGNVSFAFIGRTMPDKKQSEADEKGSDVLLDAVNLIHTSPIRTSGLALVEGMELHIYGPVSASLSERIQRMPDITVHGFMTNDRLREVLRQHDVLMFPSRYAFDGHPGVIIEAFMAGLPVIASDLPGPSEIVHHEVNGLIVKTGDADALAAAMIRLSTDGALRQRLAAGARASASDFDQDEVLPELVKALGLHPAGK